MFEHSSPPPTERELELIDRQLLREPHRPEQIKPRLLGHWERRPASTSSTPISTASPPALAWPRREEW